MRLPRQVEPNPAHPLAVQIFQLPQAGRRRKHRYATQRIGVLLQMGEQVGIVRAVETGLHQHAVRHTHRL